jgi:ATP-dependent helicase/nuclease subunit B
MGTALREFMHTGGANSVLQQIFGWFMQSEEYAPKLEVMQRILLEDIGEERLSSSSFKRLYGGELSLNVSKLERYVQCPFAYFIKHNLGAQERRVYEARALEIGNLYHETLELFTKRQAGCNWRDLNQEGIERGVDECIAEVAPKLGSEVLSSTARYRYVQKQAARVLKRSIWALSEHIKSGAFEIFETELGFGVGEPVKEVVLTLANGRRLTLHGRIDRVDIMDSGGKRYVKIIDYKSGNNKFDLAEVYFGTQLQLMLYMDAFIRGGAEVELLPGGVFYFNLNDPTVDFDEDALTRLDDEILSRFKMSGLALADTDVIKAIDSGIGRSSKIIPAAITAKGEAGGASVATFDEFNHLRARVVEKIKELGNQMTEGNINIFPYKKGAATGCDYCQYGAVCRFNHEKYNYNRKEAVTSASLQGI